MYTFREAESVTHTHSLLRSCEVNQPQSHFCHFQHSLKQTYVLIFTVGHRTCTVHVHVNVCLLITSISGGTLHQRQAQGYENITAANNNTIESAVSVFLSVCVCVCVCVCDGCAHLWHEAWLFPSPQGTHWPESVQSRAPPQGCCRDSREPLVVKDRSAAWRYQMLDWLTAILELWGKEKGGRGGHFSK